MLLSGLNLLTIKQMYNWHCPNNRRELRSAATICSQMFQGGTFQNGPKFTMLGMWALRRAEKARASTKDCKKLFSDAAAMLNRAVEMGP